MKTCLIADDSAIIRKVAKRILSELGFQVIEAENGEKALEACKEKMPDCILLDERMPVMDGWQFLEQLRALSNGLDPKVIFCPIIDGDATPKVLRALDLGANEYLLKPFDSVSLREKLHQVGLL